MSSSRVKVLRYSGHKYFDLRIILAVISKSPIVIDKIREDDEAPGLSEAEVTLLRLVERLTNGSTVRINITGTRVFLKPGILVGGTFSFDTGLHRSMGYFLPLILLSSPFTKQPLEITLSGLTDGIAEDPNVDYFSSCFIPMLGEFGARHVALRVNNRGFPPLGGGSVTITAKPLRSLNPVNYIDTAPLKNIRGTITAVKVSPAVPSRVIHSAREYIDEKFPVSDVYLSTQHVKGGLGGLSPGVSVVLFAEKKNGSILGISECILVGETAEEMGLRAARKLKKTVKQSGCVDEYFQPFILILMIFCPMVRVSMRFGPLSKRCLKLIEFANSALGLQFTVDSVEDTEESIVSIVGLGMANYARVVS
ncbi:hypothetical protein RCL1_003411 [Eukaryota sp. TZLM3-RCL]